MNDIDKINEIIYNTRRTGNTTWILKSAIKYPNCIIISKNKRQSTYLEKRYYQLLQYEKWYKKLYWKWFGRKTPRFLTINNNFRGYNLPIIFDNGTFFNLK